MTAVIDTPEAADADTTLAAELAAGLRALADMVEANPDINPTYMHDGHAISVWHARSAEELAAIARAALRHGGKVDKDISDGLYNLSISFGSLKTQALANRGEVCTRVQVGEETINRKVRDPEALALVPEVEITETVPVFKWECSPILGHGAGAVA